MPDRISVQMKIGGRLAGALVPGLFAATQLEGVRGEWGGGPLADPRELRQLIVNAREPLWVCDDHHHGNFDALEGFCIANGLAFVSLSEPCASADGEVRWWRPGQEAVRSEAALACGTPVLTVSSVRELIAGPSAAEALARLRRRLTDAEPPDVPPLEIEDEDGPQVV